MSRGSLVAEQGSQWGTSFLWEELGGHPSLLLFGWRGAWELSLSLKKEKGGSGGSELVQP